MWLFFVNNHSRTWQKYAKYAELYDHQVKRCKKRYVSNKWVVKIWVPENMGRRKFLETDESPKIMMDIISPPNPNPIYGH